MCEEKLTDEKRKEMIEQFFERMRNIIVEATKEAGFGKIVNEDAIDNFTCLNCLSIAAKHHLPVDQAIVFPNIAIFENGAILVMCHSCMWMKILLPPNIEPEEHKKVNERLDVMYEEIQNELEEFSEMEGVEEYVQNFDNKMEMSKRFDKSMYA